MNAYTFRRTEACRDMVGRKGKHSTRCTISFNSRSILISTQLAAMLGLDANSHVAFTYDEDKPEHIYIRPADYPDDTRDIQHCLSYTGRDRSILQCYNKAVSRHVIHHADATKSCTCFVARKPTCINGKDHYQIMVSCPIRIK